MSEENVEIVRLLEEGVRTSPEHVAAAVARFWESDGDYYPIRGVPGARPCHGREEIAQFFVEWQSVWEGVSIGSRRRAPMCGSASLTEGLATEANSINGRPATAGLARAASPE